MRTDEGIVGTVHADLWSMPGLIESKTDILNRAVKLTVTVTETLIHYKWIVEQNSVSIAEDVVRQFKPLNQLMSSIAVFSLLEGKYWVVEAGGCQYLLKIASKVALAACQVFNCAKGLNAFNLIKIELIGLTKINDRLALVGTVINLGFNLATLIHLETTEAAFKRKEIVVLRNQVVTDTLQCALIAIGLVVEQHFLLRPLTAAVAFTGFYNSVHKERVRR